MEEYIRIIEEMIEVYRSCSVDEEGFDMRVDIGFMKKECEALESLLTKYKEYDNLLGEIDSKEASDALYMLWHCALKNTEFETQKQQFEIVNAYIKKLEKENEELRADNYELNNRITDLLENIPVQKVKDKIEELEEEKLCFYSDYAIEERNNKIQVLQELLEEE